ncbi:MAG: hypothetical protein RLZZ522_2037, partial [Verrucomicrobiota bacterium]
RPRGRYQTNHQPQNKTMTLPPAIYTALPAPARIRAYLAAQARGDLPELATLRSNCPRKEYTQADAEFSDRLGRLLTLALTVESDLLWLALDWTQAAGLEVPQATAAATATAAALNAAWLALLAELGIASRDMEAAGPPRHEIVSTLLQIAPDVDPAAVAENLAAMREHLEAC